MIEKRVSDTVLEYIYDGIAEAFDATPESKRTLFLAKLAFTLGNLVGDRDQGRTSHRSGTTRSLTQKDAAKNPCCPARDYC